MDAISSTFRLFFSIFIFVLFFVLLNQLPEGIAKNKITSLPQDLELPML